MTGDPYENFDDPVIPLTKEQEMEILESAKKTVEELKKFDNED